MNTDKLQNKPLLVLMIDDDPEDREFFRMALAGLPCPVTCEFADNALQGFALLRSKKDFHPDFIFADINMPLMNGVYFLREIKKMNQLRNISVFIWSTSINSLVAETCLSLGAKGFIKKEASIALITDSLCEILCPEQVVSG